MIKPAAWCRACGSVTVQVSDAGTIHPRGGNVWLYADGIAGACDRCGAKYLFVGRATKPMKPASDGGTIT